MEKKAKIIATLGPAIYSATKLKQLVNLGVDAFRINFSHNTSGINKIVSKIRKIERSTNKKISLIADLQGVKLRVGKIKEDNQKIKYNQKYIFDSKKEVASNKRTGRFVFSAAFLKISSVGEEITAVFEPFVSVSCPQLKNTKKKTK